MSEPNSSELEDSSLNSSKEPIRRPYHGQCHCGFVRYIAWLTFPTKAPYQRSTPPVQMIRKCNCTLCHKLGCFHVRLADSPKDFALLSPLDPLKDMSVYQPRSTQMLFCKICGVYCFLLEGETEVNEIDLVSQGVDLKAAKIEGDGTKVKVFQPKADGWQEEKEHWFRINALTLDAKQEGLDLREWKEKKWIQWNILKIARGKATFGVGISEVGEKIPLAHQERTQLHARDRIVRTKSIEEVSIVNSLPGTALDSFSLALTITITICLADLAAYYNV